MLVGMTIASSLWTGPEAQSSVATAHGSVLQSATQQRSGRGIGSARTNRLLEHITPNWFASVMGTGIVANAAATLPLRVSGLHVFGSLVWLLASIALIALSTAFLLHWRRHRSTARGYAAHPVMSQFYGAPAMALLTVGAGTLLYGPALIGLPAALVVDAVLWTAGTLLGLGTSLWVPFQMITRHDKGTANALPAWLMPVVPPMVSASTGALLLPHVPAGEVRLTLLLACYGMFGLSLIIGLMTMTLVYSRLLQQGPLAGSAAPTIWITLGMVGQSITAANLLGAGAHLVVDEPLATGLRVFGVLFGLVMGGFGALFFALAVALTLHATRRGMPFGLTWWSFTFPIGTCVTGATALGTASGSAAVHGLADLLYVLLLVAWVTVTRQTLRGVIDGRLLRAA